MVGVSWPWVTTLGSRWLAAGALWLVCSSVSANGGFFGELLHEDEAALLHAIEAVDRGELDAGIESLAALVKRNPKFRSAQLAYADLLMARAGRFDSDDLAPREARARLAALRHELEVRLRYRVDAPGLDQFPAPLLQLSPSQRRALVVDIEAARLYVFENHGAGLQMVSDYYVSTGKRGPRKLREGDQRTPLGVYFITTQLDSSSLSDFYGAGALPINYPNEWDLLHGRTGHGIWVHGVPTDTYSRAPKASDGCMAVPNVNMEELFELTDVGRTPVVIADSLDWVDGRELDERRRAFLRQFEGWRRDWESMEPARYARHYAPEFQGDAHDRHSWLQHKQRVNLRKSYVSVGVSDLSLLAYPGEPDMLVASFKQDYKSNNYKGVSRKRQYWRMRPDGQWQVVYEGRAQFRPIHLRGIPFSSRSGIALNVH